MESNESYMILSSLTLILMLVGSIGGHPRNLQAGASEAIWQYFMKSYKNRKSHQCRFQTTLSKWAILHRFYWCFWEASLRPHYIALHFLHCSQSIWDRNYRVFSLILIFLQIKKKYWFPLRVAVCSVKCKYVLLRMGFILGKVIFWNETLLIFDSHACSR